MHKLSFSNILNISLQSWLMWKHWNYPDIRIDELAHFDRYHI